MSKQSKPKKIESENKKTRKKRAKNTHLKHEDLITMGALIASGKSSNFIADKLNCSTATVSNHREEAVELYKLEGAEVSKKALRRSWHIIKEADSQTIKKLKKADSHKAAKIAKIHTERVQLLDDNPTEIQKINMEVEDERPSIFAEAVQKLVGSGKKKDNQEGN